MECTGTFFGYVHRLCCRLDHRNLLVPRTRWDIPWDMGEDSGEVGDESKGTTQERVDRKLFCRFNSSQLLERPFTPLRLSGDTRGPTRTTGVPSTTDEDRWVLDTSCMKWRTLTCPSRWRPRRFLVHGSGECTTHKYWRTRNWCPVYNVSVD